MLAKLLSAVALTVLASTQSLLVELAKSRNGGATPFTPSAVFFTELLKLLIALGSGCAASFEYDGLRLAIPPFLLFAIPALLFIVQNNAVFLAVGLLDRQLSAVGVLQGDPGRRARARRARPAALACRAALLLLALGMW